MKTYSACSVLNLKRHLLCPDRKACNSEQKAKAHSTSIPVFQPVIFKILFVFHSSQGYSCIKRHDFFFSSAPVTEFQTKPSPFCLKVLVLLEQIQFHSDCSSCHQPITYKVLLKSWFFSDFFFFSSCINACHILMKVLLFLSFPGKFKHICYIWITQSC